MKTKISKSEAQRRIDEFFQKDNFTTEEVKKIKRLAMKFNIKLSEHRKKFCKKCLCKLKGKTRVSRTHKNVVCESCGAVNRDSFGSE